MQRTYCVSLARAGLVGLAAIAILLAHPGTSIAGEASESTRAGDGTQLQRGAGYAADGRRASVRAVQRTLRALGWRPGRVDGLFGPQTEAAVRRVQTAAGLAADGIVGPQTRTVLGELDDRVLRRGAGYAGRAGSDRVRRLQRELRRRGLKPGAVDGRFGPQTERALARLQQDTGVPASGALERSTRRLLAGAGGNPAREQAERDDRRVAVPPQMPRPRARPAATQTASELDGFTLGSVALGAALVLLIGLVAGQAVRRVTRIRDGIAAPSARVVAEGEALSVRQPKAEAISPPVPDPEPEQDRQVAVGSNGVLAVGYASVPHVADQAQRLHDQCALIDTHCERHGWRLLEVVHDKDKGDTRALARRGMQYALDRMLRGDATYLVVPSLQVLGGSLPNLGSVIAVVKRSGGNLAVVDIGLDTGSSDGHVAAVTLVSIGAWESRRMEERTRKGKTPARARRANGGRPAVGDIPGLKERIVRMRAAGMTLQAISDQLNAEGVPTLRGGVQWRPSSVQAAVGYRRPLTAERRRAMG